VEGSEAELGGFVVELVRESLVDFEDFVVLVG